VRRTVLLADMIAGGPAPRYRVTSNVRVHSVSFVHTNNSGIDTEDAYIQFGDAQVGGRLLDVVFPAPTQTGGGVSYCSAGRYGVATNGTIGPVIRQTAGMPDIELNVGQFIEVNADSLDPTSTITGVRIVLEDFGDEEVGDDEDEE